jgi:hypothetical protein
MVSSYEEIQRLRRELPKNEKINEIPDDIKATIDQEFHTIVNRPYEFPRKFLFRSLLLVLFILLLPWPVDALLLPLLSNAFILTFFEAASLYPGLRIREALFRSWGWITFGICFGIWYSWISVFQTFFIASFSSFFSTAIRIGFAIIVAIIHRFSIGINIKFAVGYFTKISRNDVTSIEDVFR